MNVITVSVPGSPPIQRNLDGADLAAIQSGDAFRDHLACKEVATRTGYLESSLPELYDTDDPRGGAVVWALLAVSMAVVVGILLLTTWTASVW